MKVLVTGGANGLGRAITDLLAHEGYEPGITYFSSVAEAGQMAKDIPGLRAWQVDFNSTESVGSFLSEMQSWAPDVLVNNAVTGYVKNHFHKMDAASFSSSFSRNVDPVMKITQQFIADSRKRRSGKIITILTSYLINNPPVGLSEYVANKAYLQSMAKSWAAENASFGITSNCVSPSFMQTNLTKDTDERIIQNMIADSPTGSLITPEEVAKAVLHFVKAPSDINGVNYIINTRNDLP